MTAQELRQQFWSQGLVASWYLRKSQLDVYLLLRREKFAFIEAARRFGKTTSILSFVFEELRRHPGWICRWCFPFKNQAREVLDAEIQKMQTDCPEYLKFVFQKTDSVYVGPNGSKLYLRGVNEDRGESARGPASNIIVADEYGFWTEPQYIIKEVLFPQLEKQEGQWLIKASTPPRDLGHLYYEERELAIRRGRFIQKTIYDNEALSTEELERIIEESGGKDSPAFRRERLCEPVSDPEMLICPEYSEELNDVEDNFPRPEFYTPYVGGDSGADDNTALLFGYHDSIDDEIIIEDELVIHGKTTREIVEIAKSIEKSLWGDLKPRKRVYDSTKQLLLDVFVEHKYPVSFPLKADKYAAVHELRRMVGSRKFKIKKKCVQLRRQLKVGMWKDDRHSDFQRSEGLGHLDAIAAAIYLNRSVDRKHNPWPLNPGVSRYTHFISPVPSPQGQTEQALKSVFGKARGLR
jgi:hypothetical protein